MKGLLCYHSNSGNTKLTCHYLQSKLENIELELYDVAQNHLPDLAQYQVVGFATWTYFLGLPPYFRDFIQRLPSQADKPAFIFNTFGMMSGQTLKQMGKSLTEKGFSIIASHSFHTPESYPPYILKGWDSSDAPDAKELEQFNQFITHLDAQLTAVANKHPFPQPKIKTGFFNHLIRPYSHKKALQQIGRVQVEQSKCTECGICQEVCLYQAIEMNPMPEFDHDKCQGCWACYNHCPESAIFTDTIKSGGYYPHPTEQFITKMNNYIPEI